MSAPPADAAPWRMPVLLAGLTLFGLLDALPIDSALARLLAWAALAVPLGVALRCVRAAVGGAPIG
ncbi:MAG: hypothetical protein WDN03_06420 [Rhizomicrobium sp.]